MRKNVFELTTPHCHGGIFNLFLSTDQKINFFYNREYLKEYLGVTNNQKSSFPRHGYFSKLEQFGRLCCEKGEPYIANVVSRAKWPTM